MNTEFRDLSQWWLAASGRERPVPSIPDLDRGLDPPPEAQQLEALAARVDAARRVY